MDGLLVLVLCGAAAAPSHSILLLHTLSYLPLYFPYGATVAYYIRKAFLSFFRSFVLSFVRSFLCCFTFRFIFSHSHQFQLILSLISVVAERVLAATMSFRSIPLCSHLKSAMKCGSCSQN